MQFTLILDPIGFAVATDVGGFSSTTTWAAAFGSSNGFTYADLGTSVSGYIFEGGPNSLHLVVDRFRIGDAAIPEPTTAVLLLAGLAGLARLGSGRS